MRRHFTAGLFFGATAAAVAYADDASPLGCLVVGALVAIAVWAVAYALDHRPH
jgi:hypothetical protein